MGAVRARVAAGIAIHCLRDLTPGGLSSAVIEIAELFRLTLRNLRFRSRKMYLVRARFSDLIPSTVPQGRFIAFVPERETARALEIL